MSRYARVQYPNAIYHVMSRGNRRQDIVVDDHDRQQFWDRLAEAVIKFGWLLFAAAHKESWCQRCEIVICLNR